MGFLYYIPGGSRTVRPADLPELAYAFDGELIARELIGAGPDGQAGVVVADASVPAEKLGYYADRQTWRRVPKTHYWVGFSTDTPPGPAELKRRRMLPGHLVEMADGRQWTVPSVIARESTDDGVAGHLALPTTVGVNDNGEWVRLGVLPQHERLSGVAQTWFEMLMDSLVTTSQATDAEEAAKNVKISMTFAEWFDAVVTVLQANYRVSAVEVTALRILNEVVAAAVLNAAVDLPTLLEYLGKKARAFAA